MRLILVEPCLRALLVALLLATGCAGSAVERGDPTQGRLQVGSIIPDLVFDGVDERGARRPIHLDEYHDPTEAGVIVLRVQGVWCGTCRWHAGHTGELLEGRAPGRLRVLDVVVRGRDNDPSTPADLGRWQALLDVSGTTTVLDPGLTVAALFPSAGVQLPYVAVIDARTMKIVSATQNPDPDALDAQIAAALAGDGTAPKRTPAVALFDGLFYRNEWDLIRDIAPPGPPPADPTNSVADDPAAAALGAALFVDTGLSPSNALACSSCHDPARQLADDRPQAFGVARGDRRTPRIGLAAHERWLFWDGRADSLWAQALGPLENPSEMGSSRMHVVRRILSEHRARYLDAFPGPLLEIDALLSRSGGSAYEALSTSDQATITRIFVNAGKAIAAYERTFRVHPTRLDAYARGDLGALSAIEKQGLATFMRAGCAQCHFGPTLSDQAFHVLRTPTGRADGVADPGRAAGLLALRASEFAATGPYSDAPDTAEPLAEPSPSMLGAFKTPSLRGVAGGGPYGHGGMVDSLSTVMEDYGNGAVEVEDPTAIGKREPWLPRFGTTAQWSIAQFLEVLTSTPE